MVFNGGLLQPQELKAWHRPQIQCLVAAGVDLIAMETIPSLKEGEALVELLQEFPNSQAWLSFSCKVLQADSSSELNLLSNRVIAEVPKLLVFEFYTMTGKYVEAGDVTECDKE